MTTTPTIQAALAAVMADVREVRKTERNEAQRFTFRGIDAVLNAVGPALRTHGVIVMPRVLDYTYGTVEVGQRRTAMGHVIVTVEYTFVGPSGDTLTSVVIGESMDSGDKAVAKAMSVALRTALLQALALPTDDPDPDATSYERSAATAASEEAFTALMDSIRQAADMDALTAAAASIQQSASAITPMQRDSLRKAFAEQRDALQEVPPSSS